MPDYFSHSVAAERIYENLAADYKEKISSHTLYLLGAQGGDVFFAYNLNFSKSNLGRDLHRRGAYDLIEGLSRGNLSYAAGFAAHYALDSTLHPAVYSYVNSHHSPLSHVNFENDLGLYMSRLFNIRRGIIPREKLLACTFPLYDSIKNVEDGVTVTGIERCLKRHFTYTRYLYKRKNSEYKCAYPFEDLEGAVKDAIELGGECVRAVLNKELPPALFSAPFLAKF
ncbi:MAG: zinc dependent phospholipase C family protein [Clostridiales bacterium]|nr:zinc dependent phospholipase C family protein [Clostridiales bacterium]